PKYRDDDEAGHTFKEPTTMYYEGDSDIPDEFRPKLVTAFTSRKRRIPDAWGFCGTCSPVSAAKKPYAAMIINLRYFVQELDFLIEQKFGQQLPILLGPVCYYSNEGVNAINPQENPPYFSKLESYKNDL